MNTILKALKAEVAMCENRLTNEIGQATSLLEREAGSAYLGHNLAARAIAISAAQASLTQAQNTLNFVSAQIALTEVK